MTSVFDSVPATETVPAQETIIQRTRKRDSLNPTQLREGRRKLADLVDTAFNTLDEAMHSADWSTATKAAVSVLDRTGFGPKSTMDINTTHVDLSNLTKEQLGERALRIHKMIAAAKDAEIVSTQQPSQALARTA